MMENWNQRQQKRTNEMIVFALLIGITATDIALTLYALDIGFVEGNPIVALLMNINIPFAIVVKYVIIVIPMLVTIVYLKKKGREMAVKGTIVGVVITAAVVIWNVIVLTTA